MRSGRKTALIAGSLAVALVGLGGGAVLYAQAADTHTVVAVKDGTISLTDGSATTDYTLAGVTMPAPGDEQNPASCLASDANAYLAGMLPPGTSVKVQPTTGAAVTVAVDNRVANVEVVRAGLAAVNPADASGKLASDLAGAAAEAAEAGRGLHADATACSAPGRVAAFEQKVAAAAAAPAPESKTGALEARVAELQALLSEADGVAALLAGDTATLPMAAHGEDARAGLQARLTAARTSVEQLQVAAKANLDALRAEQAAAAARAAAEKAKKEQEKPLFVPPADGVYDCIAPWDYAESWTQYEEDVYYACVATIP